MITGINSRFKIKQSAQASQAMPTRCAGVWLGSLGIWLCCASAVSFAQDEASNSDSSIANATERRSFTPDDFAQFAPRNALDMVEEIPGFSIRQGNSGARGLGQADVNVLINRQRISGKSNGPVEALSRIPADDVVSLEILDGASLDIGGLSGQVLNVNTLNSGRIAGQFRYSPQYRTKDTPFVWGDVEVSMAGGGSQDEWTLSLENDQSRFAVEGPEQVFDGQGELIDRRQERLEERTDLIILAGSYARYGESGSVFNITAEANGFIFDETELSEQSGPNQPDRLRTLRFTEDEFNYEVGADYAFDLLTGRLKLIGYHRFEHSPTTSGVRTMFDDNRADQGSLFTREADEAESIFRTEYFLSALGGDWQASVEAARNYLDIEAELERRDANGMLQPVDLPGANSRVDEDRVETTLTYGRSLTPRLRLQASAGAEYSHIEQTGQFGLTRSFVRPKGFVSLDWQASDALDFSFRVEREVGQLNFFDFIASADVNQGQDNVSNVNLVPPQTWLFELQINRSLGAFGSLTMLGFFEDISDIVDQIPIEGGGQAPGNIDSATRWGISANWTLLSEPLGWAGTRLDLNGDFFDSSVNDPLLGTSRRISGRDYINFEARLRQDFIGTDWAAGLNIDYDENSPSIRLDQESFFRTSFAFASMFVENKDVLGLTLRATVGNVLDRDDKFTRTVFTDRRTGQVDFVEDRERNFGMNFRLDIEGSF